MVTFFLYHYFFSNDLNPSTIQFINIILITMTPKQILFLNSIIQLQNSIDDLKASIITNSFNQSVNDCHTLITLTTLLATSLHVYSINKPDSDLNQPLG